MSDVRELIEWLRHMAADAARGKRVLHTQAADALARLQADCERKDAALDDLAQFVPRADFYNLKPETRAALSPAEKGETRAEEAARLRQVIQNVLDGNYPNPREHRPGACAHGVFYWQPCEQCLDEYLAAALAPPANPEEAGT